MNALNNKCTAQVLPKLREPTFVIHVDPRRI
jgi:hypothetical protein